MAFKLDDRIRETSTAPGTGSFTVNGAVQSAQSFASVLTSNGDTTWYTATNGTAWETGLLTRTSATVYARTTIFSSSNSGSAVNFASGTVDVFCDLPGKMAEHLNFTEIAAASASTCDIGTPQGTSINVTGTTTITSFGSAVNKLRIVRFSGALTLTHNATSLILKRGVNRVTAANDIGIYKSDSSGNWRELFYQRGSNVPVNIQKFTSSGTYTPTAGMTHCEIVCLGGGGAGGGCVGLAGTNGAAGSGGGSGSLSIKLATAADIGASQTVTIGAGGAGSAGAAGGNGGDTSVGSLCVGKGGSGGDFGSAAHNGAPGAGGVAGTGDVTGTGAPGFAPPLSSWATSTAYWSAKGGDSPYGGGGASGVAGTGNGAAASGYGAGGGGAFAFNSATNQTGGAGSPGLVIIEEFFAA